MLAWALFAVVLLQFATFPWFDLAVVDQTMQPTQASLWQRPPR